MHEIYKIKSTTLKWIALHAHLPVSEDINKLLGALMITTTMQTYKWTHAQMNEWVCGMF